MDQRKSLEWTLFPFCRVKRHTSQEMSWETGEVMEGGQRGGSKAVTFLKGTKEQGSTQNCRGQSHLVVLSESAKKKQNGERKRKGLGKKTWTNFFKSSLAKICKIKVPAPGKKKKGEKGTPKEAEIEEVAMLTRGVEA